MTISTSEPTERPVPEAAQQDPARPAYLSVRGLQKIFDGDKGVKGIDFDVAEGEFVTLLGSSGCGKTTTLRCLSGVETPDRGEILVDGAPMWSDRGRVALAPEHRDVGVVFQSYALWPHMSVRRNVIYPLRARKVPRQEADAKAEEILGLVGLLEHADKFPSQLSGGQQQRVALARALVYRPKLLLLDEPLSNLDAQLRESMRRDIRRLQRTLGITAVYVTHDRIEAMTMSDRIIVMSDGRIDQIGSPEELYAAPRTRTVAALLTSASLLPGVVRGGSALAGEHVRVALEATGVEIDASAAADVQGGDTVALCFRPGDVRLTPRADGSGGLFQATVIDAYSTGSEFEYVVDVGGRTLKSVGVADQRIHSGDVVDVHVEGVMTCVAAGSEA